MVTSPILTHMGEEQRRKLEEETLEDPKQGLARWGGSRTRAEETQAESESSRLGRRREATPWTGPGFVFTVSSHSVPGVAPSLRSSVWCQLPAAAKVGCVKSNYTYIVNLN